MLDKKSAFNARDIGEAGFNPWVREIPWRRKWQTLPVFLPEKSHEQRSLACFSSMWIKNFQIYKLGLEKEEEPEIIANIHWIREKARELEKNIYLCFIDYTKAFDCVNHTKLWEILQELGIPDYLTCLLRNLYVGQEATARNLHGSTDWFKIGKGIQQGCILSPCLLNLYTEYIMQNAGLDKSQAGNKIAWRNINKLRQEMISKRRGIKETLDEGERGEWKCWLKTQH